MTTIEIEVSKEDAERVKAVLSKPVSQAWTKADKSAIAGVLIAVAEAYIERAYEPAVGDRIDVKDRGYPWSDLEASDVQVVAVYTEDDWSEVVVRTSWGDYQGYDPGEYDFRKAG